MKKFIGMMWVAAAAVVLPFSASAYGLGELISPAEGPVTQEGHFPDILLGSEDCDVNTPTVTMTSSEGETIDVPWSFDMNSRPWSVRVDCSKIVKSGTWTLTIPAGSIYDYADSSIVNEAKSYTWNYTNPTEGQATVVTVDAFITDNSGKRVNPGDGITSIAAFPNINLELKTGYNVNGTSLRVTNDKGFDKNVDINASFYEMGAIGQIPVNTLNENITTSGKYTLYVPANFFTASDGTGNEAVEFSWDYTYTGSTGGGDQEGDLVVKSVDINGTDVLTSKALASIGGGDVIDITIDPIADAQMLYVTFGEKDGELLRTIEIYNRTGNNDFVVDPATGSYKVTLGGNAVSKFYTGSDYVLEITACTKTNLNDPSGVTYGPFTVDFTGTTVPFNYSPATVVSVTPANDFEVVDPTQPIVITYSAPVELTKVEASTGGQFAEIVDMTQYATASADKTIWTVRPGKAFWNASGNNWMFMFYAKDENGLVVKGNSGEDEGSYYQVTYGCFLSWPEVTITPASGMVEELYEFSVADSRGIGLSYNYVPYIEDAEGNKVAQIDMDSQEQFDANGVNLKDIPMDQEVLGVKATFHLKEAITTPGAYKFIIPRAALAIGTQFDSDYNRYQEIAYTVVKMPKAKVNVELVNFGTTSFEVLQGKNATVTLTPAEDWKLATLKCNDNDVTADVKDGAYTIAAIEEDANIVATFEFAHEVKVIETSGVVAVDGRDLKVSSDAENITIEGLAEGDVVKVFTLNGMNIVNTTATQDIMKISAPAGDVYVVMINKTAFKIKH